MKPTQSKRAQLPETKAEKEFDLLCIIILVIVILATVILVYWLLTSGVLTSAGRAFFLP